MVLSLCYRGGATVPVEVEGVVPDLLSDKSLAQIEKLPVWEGNRPACLADFFDVSGDASDEIVLWKGDLRGVHWIGAKMRRGRMEVDGSAGRHVGSEMRGGEIRVAGDVGDWVGGEMHGGLIHVHGRAGHLVGAAYRGSARGMTRGTILIEGDAGNEIGHTMRRGFIAIGGRVGDLVGFNMLAGTIMLFGQAGIRHGAGMHRGTIAFFSEVPGVLPSFRHACRTRPLILALMLKYLDDHGFPVPESARDGELELYHGDMLEGGRGEIWTREA